LLHNPDLQQATVSLYFPTGDYSNDSEVDYAAFNQYFGGGGLNDLFFLNIREKRSLAYGTGGYAAYNPYNKTSYFISQTGTQNDKVAQVIDIAMNLIDSMPVLPSRINDIKTNVKSEYLSSKPSFRAKSQYLDQLRRVGYTDDPAKINMSKIEALTFDNILKVYSEKIKNRPVIIVIYGDQKNIDTKAIESKYGKINRVPVSKIFKGGDY
jgi:predicted Zn-dependent peptidase